jgi:hypothetical protein
MVIFQDYHFKEEYAVLTRLEEEGGMRTGGLIIKAFVNSGVKACFRRRAGTKAFTSYRKFRTMSIARTLSGLFSHNHYDIPDCVRFVFS